MQRTVETRRATGSGSAPDIQVRQYPGTYHGFAVRGSPKSTLVEAAKRQVRHRRDVEILRHNAHASTQQLLPRACGQPRPCTWPARASWAAMFLAKLDVSCLLMRRGCPLQVMRTTVEFLAGSLASQPDTRYQCAFVGRHSMTKPALAAAASLEGVTA